HQPGASLPYVTVRGHRRRRRRYPSLERCSQTTDALAEKSPATHTPKHLAEKAGELAVLEGAPARVALLAAAAVLLLLRLGALGVSAPDEPVYTEMAEEVRSFEHGPTGLVLLHLNGKPNDQKPPLYYWAAALFGAPGGRVTETAARLPSALAGIGCVWLVLQIGTLLFSRRAALDSSGARLDHAGDVTGSGRLVSRRRCRQPVGPLLPRPLPPSPLVLLLHPVPHPLDALESLLACRRVGRVAPGLRRARRSGAGAGLAIPPRVGRRDVHLLLDLR